MSLRPDSELAWGFFRGIERLLGPHRPLPFTREEARRLMSRFKIAILRWEQATCEQDRRHQDSILGHIDADADLDLVRDPIIPSEIFSDAHLPWNWAIGDTDQENMCIEQHTVRVLLYMIWKSIDKFYPSTAETIFVPDTPRTLHEINYFLTRLQVTIYVWEQAVQDRNIEWQQRILTRLSDGQDMADYSDPELLEPETYDPNLPWNNESTQIDMPDFSLSQEADDFLENLSQDILRHSAIIEGSPHLLTVESGQVNLEGSLLQDIAHSSLLLREKVTDLLEALSLLGIGTPRRTSVVWRRLNQEENEMTCIICQQNVQLGTVSVELPCRHSYHPQCIADWLVQNDTCPLCRSRIVI